MNATINHVFIKGTNELMQCIKCQTFDMLGFKKVDHKHPHCVGCYKEVQKEKRNKCKCCGKKHGKDECEGVNCGACNDHDYYPLTLLDGVMRCSFCVDDYNNGLECECCGMCDKSVGLSTGENGLEMHVCDLCDIDGSNYDGWGDEKEEVKAESEPAPKNDWAGFTKLWSAMGLPVEKADAPCKCTDAMDIRGRCQIDKAGFAKCPAFADTACFCICNDSDLDMKIQASENLGINCTPIIIQWLSDRNIPADLHEPILNLYNEWRVDERESPNVYPYKKCSECGERKSCGCYQDDEWFCEDCAEEEEEDCRTKPCSCGCGYLGGSCDKGLAIDNGEDDEEHICPGCENVINKNEESFEYEWAFDITTHIHVCKKCFDADELDLIEYNLCSLSEEEKNAKDIFSRIRM